MHRDRFPILQRNAYFAAHSYAPLSTDVRAAYEHYLEARERDGAPWDAVIAKNEDVRGLIADLLGATPHEIAVTASASAAISAIASAMRFDRPRNRIVITDLEFPTMGQIWAAQAPRGAELVIAPSRDGALDEDAFDALLDERVALCAFTAVSYRTGAHLNVKSLARKARAVGALSMCDAYQALGAEPLDARESGLDFVVGGAAKYLLGSPGVGFIYVRSGLDQALNPTATGWFAQRDIMAMDHTRHDPAPGARRFESGTPNGPSLFAAAAGLRMILEIGPHSIAAHVAERHRELRAGVETLGAVLAAAPPFGPLLAIRASDPAATVEHLAAREVATSWRGDAVRLSPHFYTSEDDVARALDALATAPLA